ncbi:hypothetical protein RHMOL_Rhmol04G0374400 [Rhododendron molle]|uniref:Uncharacterized protein n=1 Tax=Rhododendron molle TaxID=49168 RepID=A0ACC0P9L6_RHOML|nr:hypothetical protein RHMOL_Rhmol04G0374400 [Rhododendron molle]
MTLRLQHRRRAKQGFRKTRGSNQMDSGAWDGSAAAAEDHESLSSTNDAELLKRAWRTEKAAPEILQFEAGLVQRSREQIQLVVKTPMVMNNDDLGPSMLVYLKWKHIKWRCLREGNVEDFVARGSDPLIVSLNQMDMDRTLYLLRSYLRTRLQKIEKYMFHIHKNTELWNRLSEQEQKFAQRCIEDLEDHFDKSVLSKLPDRYKSSVKQSVISEEDDMVPEPQLDTYLICRTKGSLGALQLDDRQSIIFFGGVEDPVDLDPGDLYAVRYKSIKPLVYSGQIELV